MNYYSLWGRGSFLNDIRIIIMLSQKIIVILNYYYSVIDNDIRIIVILSQKIIIGIIFLSLFNIIFKDGFYFLY